ncbi:MAG TPA: alpha/beta-hydrolase family protein [Devosia sp.]|nr:alpha/beta-hydrolase family protein [Devosia sp.]
MGSYVSIAGLIVGILFFALSLTPSLIPRPAVIQGLLSGCVFAVGYAAGAVLFWFWAYLQLHPANPTVRRWLRWGLLSSSGLIAVICLYRYTGWQNTVRAQMQLEPASDSQVLVVIVLSLIPALVLVAIGTLITRGTQRVAALLRTHMPPRAATLAGIVIVGIVTGLLVNGVLVRGLLNFADETFLRVDAIVALTGNPAPTDPLRSGSDASLVPWTSIGRDGRVYVETQPAKADIETVTGRPAQNPLRTYVGLRSAETLAQRADLALAEMLRIGAFDRSTIVIIMPVGTGWIDPPSIDALEYLLEGDIASVAIQYSYLTSPLSLLVEPDEGVSTAQAIFDVVYKYWRALPADQRPRLFLSGLSLGASSSQASTMFLDVLAAPFDGALWVGPPFTSTVWRWSTANRADQSPEWRPVFGDSSSVRFANRGTDLSEPGGNWGPMRIAFLQYPSDPIVFVDYDTIFRAPAWMRGERGEGVSPEFHWYPIITFLQLAMDMALSNTSPIGYGHVYSATDYADAWYALVEPEGWDAAKMTALKAALLTNTGRS